MAFLALVLGLLILCAQAALFPLAVSAEGEWPQGLALSSVGETAVVMDVDSGALLYAFGANEKHYPASITKVMTGMLALEHGNLDDTVTFTKEAVFGIERGSAHIARDVDEQMPLRDCMYAMMLESANECAYAIAEHIGGDYDTFINMMNEKAKALGCENTHFCNSNGLFDENHYTSAYDMALIAREAFHNETFAEICGTKTYTIPPTNIHEEETYLNNHHAMLNYYKTKRYLYEFCVGGKTGYTTEANNTLVTYAKKDGQTLVCVVLNAEQGCHYNDTRRLFDYCFEHFDTIRLDGTSVRKDLPQIDGADAFTEIDLSKTTLPKDAAVTLPAGVELSETEKKLTFLGQTEGDPVIGELTFTYAGHDGGRVKLLYERPTIAEPIVQGEVPAVEAHRRFENAVKWILPGTGIAVGVAGLLLIRHIYVEAPYRGYYGSKLLRRHFRRRRKRRKGKRRRPREREDR